MKPKILILILLLVLSVPIISVTKNKTEQKIAELEKQLQNQPGTEKISTLLDLAGYTYTEAPEKCVDYCRQILKLTEQINEPKKRARALIYLSYALSILGDWEKPFEHSKEALRIYENQKDKAGIGRALHTIGYFYRKIDYFNIALDYFLRSLKVYEEIGNKKDLFFPYYNLGSLHTNLEDYQKALEYFRKALNIAEESKRTSQVSTILHNIGLCYRYLGDYMNALDYFQKALKLLEDSGNTYWIAAALSNIGSVYVNVGSHEQALKYLSQAQQLREKIGDKVGLFHTFCLFGDTHLRGKNYQRALSYYDRAFHIVKELKDKNNLEKIYKKYAYYYAAFGDYKNAFDYHSKYCETRELLFNQKKEKQLAELELQFETEKRVKEIEILKKDNKIQKITRNAFISGFVLVSIILILLFKKYLYLFAFWKRQKYIGQYRVIDTIGTGGMGTVYLAHTIRDKNRLSAVKVLKEELVEDESSRQRFKHEGTIIDKVSHPNIVKIYERGDYKGKLYIVMEYLRGKTLAQKIKEEGKIELKECLFIMKQMAEALAFIHKKNIVHRDLKPANIMLIEENSRSNVVKLLDFGVALMKFQTRLTQTGILVGTIHYIAPEQITENLYSPAGDCYSMGMIFYEMLAGTPAFHRDTLTAVVEKILAEPPKPVAQLRPGMPEELNLLITQLLAKEPEQRPSAEDVLLHLRRIARLSGV